MALDGGTDRSWRVGRAMNLQDGEAGNERSPQLARPVDAIRWIVGSEGELGPG